MKKILASIIFAFLAIVPIFAKEHNMAKDMETAASLAADFMQKLESNTPFSYADGVKFFGELPSPTINMKLHRQLGYITGSGEWLSRPKYSPLGELLRMNRDIFLPVKNLNKSYMVGKQLFVNKDNETLWPAQQDYVVVINTDSGGGNAINCENATSTEFSITVIGNSCVLHDPIIVNGKNILKELGFYYNGRSDWGLTSEALEKLKNHLKELEKNFPNVTE